VRFILAAGPRSVFVHISKEDELWPAFLILQKTGEIARRKREAVFMSRHDEPEADFKQAVNHNQKYKKPGISAELK
jgi:hypothetical protein